MRPKKLVTVAAVALGATLGGGGAAWASHEAGHYPGSSVGGTETIRTGPAVGARDPGDPAAPARTGRTEGTGLPLTGGDVVGLTLIGLGAVGAGTVLVRRSLRPST